MENSEDVLQIDKKLSDSERRSCDQFFEKINSPNPAGDGRMQNFLLIDFLIKNVSIRVCM